LPFTNNVSRFFDHLTTEGERNVQLPANRSTVSPSGTAIAFAGNWGKYNQADELEIQALLASRFLATSAEVSV
jgi:hypothetical protein